MKRGFRTRIDVTIIIRLTILKRGDVAEASMSVDFVLDLSVKVVDDCIRPFVVIIGTKKAMIAVIKYLQKLINKM